MIEREKGRRRDIEREGEIERDVRDIERDRVKGRGIEHSPTGCALS